MPSPLFACMLRGLSASLRLAASHSRLSPSLSPSLHSPYFSLFHTMSEIPYEDVVVQYIIVRKDLRKVRLYALYSHFDLVRVSLSLSPSLLLSRTYTHTPSLTSTRSSYTQPPLKWNLGSVVAQACHCMYQVPLHATLSLPSRTLSLTLIYPPSFRFPSPHSRRECVCPVP